MFAGSPALADADDLCAMRAFAGRRSMAHAAQDCFGAPCLPFAAKSLTPLSIAPDSLR